MENGIGFERYVDGDSRAAQAPAPSVGTWHHIAGVYDGSLLQLFIDGTLVESANDGRPARVKRTILRGGYGWSDLAGAIRGTLDELAIYDKALSAERIGAHFEAAK